MSPPSCLQAAPPALWWGGHATVSVRLDGVHLMTDPLLRNWLGPIRRRRGTIDPAAIEPVDAVLISHLHHDHLDFPSLRTLGRDTPVIVPAGAGEFVSARGFGRVEELPHGAALRVGAVTVTSVPAVHRGDRLFGPEAASSGYLIEGSQAIYFAGDTARFPAMCDLAGGVDTALLPVGGWGPTLGEEGHMDWHEAARALSDIGAASAVPIHWGTFWPAGLEWFRRERFALPGPRFAEEVARLLPGAQAHLLAPGQRLALGAGVSQQPAS